MSGKPDPNMDYEQRDAMLEVVRREREARTGVDVVRLARAMQRAGGWRTVNNAATVAAEYDRLAVAEGKE